MRTAARGGLIWSPVELKGRQSGRLWEVFACVDSPFFNQSRGLVLQTNFRGAPPGKEPERTIPYVFIGPAPRVLPTAVLGGVASDVLSLFKRPAPDDSAWLTQASRPQRYLAKASYPKVEEALASVWREKYESWCDLVQASALHTPFPPMVVGVAPTLNVMAGFNLNRSPDAYAMAVEDTVSLVETLEPSFDAPRPAEVEVPLKLGKTGEGESSRPLYQCPQCGKMETVKKVIDTWGRLRNYKTTGCGVLLYHPAE